MKVNDYCRGAMEALAWMEDQIEDLSRMTQDAKCKSVLEHLQQTVKDVEADIKKGIAVDFEGRIRAQSRF